ncbi:MAG: cell division protein FtsB [Moraxellaceae bacterium]|nr:cell division protein FtsB [Moraxellaceae bacterium]
MLRTPFGKLLLALALALFLFLQYSLWVGEGGVRDVQALKHSVAALSAENEKLAERNRVLEAEVKDLKNGLEAVEEHSRLDLGMVRDNETFYLVTGNPDAKKTAPAAP